MLADVTQECRKPASRPRCVAARRNGEFRVSVRDFDNLGDCQRVERTSAFLD
jgi:hypothetical protein